MRNRSLKHAQKVFKKQMDRFIEVNGRPILVLLPQILSDCPNCLNDPIFYQGESVNKYNTNFIRPVNIFPGTSEEQTIYPQPFNVDALPSGITFDPADPNPRIINSTICPVCRGKGKLAVQPNVCINANFNWHPRSGLSDGMIMDLSPGRLPDNIGIIKTDLCNFAICKDSIGFIVDSGVECKMITPPVKKGVGEDAFVEIYVQKIDSTDTTSHINDEDARLNVRPVAESSAQADPGTPHSPPNTFSNEDW